MKLLVLHPKQEIHESHLLKVSGVREFKKMDRRHIQSLQPIFFGQYMMEYWILEVKKPTYHSLICSLV